MTRITGVAIDQESGQPIVGRPVYAYVAPRDTPMADEPINPPNGSDRTKTGVNGEWELNLRRTSGITGAYYIIRVWQHTSVCVDVPSGPGPFTVDQIDIDPGTLDPDQPDNWQFPAYIPVSEKAAPSGVATLGSDGKLALAQRWAVSGGGGGDSGPLAYQHTQTMPSTVWVIAHDLPFQPSGVVVYDHLGERHFPNMSFLNDSTIQMQFTGDVRGVAHLS